MLKKTDFQDFHYLRKKLPFGLKLVLGFGEFFYKNAVLIKNFLYDIKILKEKETGLQVICVGNLTTGGVGKTPITINLANDLSKDKTVAIVSRGYGAKLNNKNPNVIKDNKGIKFENGALCGDEPYQIAKKVNDKVVVITCSNRLKAINLAIVKYGVDTVILDDGFSNRTVKKTKSIIVIDSKMRFGSNHLLPLGPLREPISSLKRADEIILVDKDDDKIQEAINWVKNLTDKKIKLCKMEPDRIYNLLTKANLKTDNKTRAIAFCAIGQPEQFFNFAKKYYDIKDCISFSDHYKYTKADIKKLTEIAKENNSNVLLTTQKDETKIKPLIQELKEGMDFTFNVLELKNTFETIN